MMVTASSLLGLAVLIFLFDRGESQICYDCISTGNSPSDPSIQKALSEMQKLHNSNPQCATFPYFQSNSIQTVNCWTKNLTEYPNILGGQPFTDWQCQLQQYTMTLKNYGNGITVQVPVAIRGCVPVQWGNPYYLNNCTDIQSSKTNPYIMAILKSHYWPQLNVGAIPGSETGTYCQCNKNWCNSAPRSARSGVTTFGGLLTALVAVVRLLNSADASVVTCPGHLSVA